MEEIKIYISIKRLLLVFLATAAFLAALFGLRYHLVDQHDKLLDTMLSVIGPMLIFLAYFLYLSRRTRLIISDVQLRVNATEPWVVQLSGVESFYVDKFKGRKFIGIRYKDNIEGGFPEEVIAEGRKRRFKAALQGYPYEIYVRGLSKTPQEICDLLNQRLKEIQA